jgi:hypothetical protein
MAYSTNDQNAVEYQALNHYGPDYWIVQIKMDCSKTSNGWFELKVGSESRSGHLGRGTECTSQHVGKNRRCQQNGKRDVGFYPRAVRYILYPLGARLWLRQVNNVVTQGFESPGAGWEGNINQAACSGTGGGTKPFTSINHVARCGYANVFVWGDGSCRVDRLS